MTSCTTATIHHKRARRWEAFDKVTIEVVPRYKTSHLSGDEWRTSVMVQFWFKGVMVHAWSTGTMQGAIMCLGGEWEQHSSPIHEGVRAREKTACDQPGCDQDATAKFVLIRETSKHGEWLDPRESSLTHYRQFCEKHSQRGDCSREDADDNYQLCPGGP